MEIYFGTYVIFGKKNQRETMPEGAHEGEGHALGPRGHSIRRFVPSFRRKKVVLKFQPNRS